MKNNLVGIIISAAIIGATAYAVGRVVIRANDAKNRDGAN